MTTGGTRANRRGQNLENFVEGILEDAHYEAIWPSWMIFAMREMGQPVYAKQVEVGRNIYGKIRRVDFFLFHPLLHPNGLVIQCKWQGVSGSVEEKYPYEVLSIQAGEYDTIILLDGGGYSKGAAEWLRGQAGEGHLKDVLDQGEFQRFASRGLL